MSTFFRSIPNIRNYLIVGSILTTSFVGVNSLVNFTNTNITSVNFERKINSSLTQNQAILVSTNHNQTDAIPYYNQGTKYLEAKRFQEAIPFFNQALKIDSNFADAYLHRGAAYFFTREHSKAISDFETASKIYKQENNQTGIKKAEHAIRRTRREIVLQNNRPSPNINRTVPSSLETCLDLVRKMARQGVFGMTCESSK